MNYKSVVMYAKPEELKNEPDKMNAMEIIFEHLIPGRWNEIIKPNKKELDLTSVFMFSINEASAKIRSGPAVDDREDLKLNVWAGVLPFITYAGEAVNNPDLKENIPLPVYVKNFNAN